MSGCSRLVAPRKQLWHVACKTDALSKAEDQTLPIQAVMNDMKKNVYHRNTQHDDRNCSATLNGTVHYTWIGWLDGWQTDWILNIQSITTWFVEKIWRSQHCDSSVQVSLVRADGLGAVEDPPAECILLLTSTSTFVYTAYTWSKQIIINKSFLTKKQAL